MFMACGKQVNLNFCCKTLIFQSLAVTFKKRSKKQLKISANFIFKFASKLLMKKMIYNMTKCVFLSGKHVTILDVSGYLKLLGTQKEILFIWDSEKCCYS